MRRRYLFPLLGAAAGAGLFGAAFWQRAQLHGQLHGVMNMIDSRLRRQRTVDEVLIATGPAARARMESGFDAAGIAYPPQSVTLIGLKAEWRLEVWVPRLQGRAAKVADHPVLAASGGPGPKLREGDRQVPEGLYPITFLNANSRFHLSLRVGYPNAEDRAHAAREGRTNLGGDIMIHGAGGSVGCLALANESIEELFVLVADVGIAAVQTILAPHDMRGDRVPAIPPGAPEWTAARYATVHAAMARFAAAEA